MKAGVIDDHALIAQLNARYTHALDGLVPDAANAWAQTFTPDGHVAVVAADGTSLAEARGRPAIADVWRGFPDVDSTHHWLANVLIEVDGLVARMSAYVAAVSIKTNPATWVRTSLYADRLSRDESGWLFVERILTLDPMSRI